MSVAAKKKPATRKRATRAKKKQIVFGLGATGLSVARYLKRSGGDAIFVDSRDEPPGIDELADIMPGAEVLNGKSPAKLLKKAARIIVSPGASDAESFLQAAREHLAPGTGAMRKRRGHSHRGHSSPGHRGHSHRGHSSPVFRR